MKLNTPTGPIELSEWRLIDDHWLRVDLSPFKSKSVTGPSNFNFNNSIGFYIYDAKNTYYLYPRFFGPDVGFLDDNLGHIDVLLYRCTVQTAKEILDNFIQSF